MSARDRLFVQKVGLPVAQVARALQKTKQTVNRGIRSPNDYLKPTDVARALQAWRPNLELHSLARAAACEAFPDDAQTILTLADGAGTPPFASDVAGEFWFVCGDFAAFRSGSSLCADQLEAVCAFEEALVIIFVNAHDEAAVRRLADRHPHTRPTVIICEADLRLMPSTLLRIDLDDNIDLFGAGERGFAPLSRQEGLRLRSVIRATLMQ